MNIAIITGSSGLIGSEAVKFLSKKFDQVVGIDNNYRQRLFGEDASTLWMKRHLLEEVSNFTHIHADIRNYPKVEEVFQEYSTDISLVIHTAAQPSHDWAAKEPQTDFSINAHGTSNLLELTRLYAPTAVFEFTSTNKVYGDRPNELPLIERETRWEVDGRHRFSEHGIDESMSIDQTKHSLFGASKVAADILCQEYGRYFGMKVGVFRGGCLTGPNHSGTQLHGFLSYLMKCTLHGLPYTVFGYQGKQVRDNIHSYDFVNALWHFYQKPRAGEVYNMGGSRHSHCSMLEAITLCEEITGKKLQWKYEQTPRIGDHIWYVSDVRKFQKHFPRWQYSYTLRQTVEEIALSVEKHS
jgi:CDP-paratose 2-epimerase